MVYLNLGLCHQIIFLSFFFIFLLQWVWHPKELGVPYKFVHFYRHPFKKIVSGFRYHLEGAEAWTKKVYQYNNTCYYPSNGNVKSTLSSSSSLLSSTSTFSTSSPFPLFSSSSSSSIDKDHDLNSRERIKRSSLLSTNRFDRNHTHLSSRKDKHSIHHTIRLNYTVPASTYIFNEKEKGSEGITYTTSHPSDSSLGSSSRPVTVDKKTISRGAVVEYCR